MSDIGEPRDRLGVLEARVEQLSVDAASTRLLAAMADREVAEIRHTVRAHTRVLNALRETQVEQGATLAEHGRTLAEHGRKLDTHGQKLDEHGGLLTTLVAGQAAIMEHLGIAPPHTDEAPQD